MAADSSASPQAEYIQHHLVHYNNTGEKQSLIADFSVINYDTIFWSLLMGVIALFVMWLAARRASAGVPGRLQSAIEMLIDMVDQQARSIVPSEATRKFVSPLALTVFVWIFLMNAMDLFPVDLFPKIWEIVYGANGGDAHHAYMRVVPSADLSTTLGLSTSVLLVCVFYNIKIKGVGGWVHELFCAPFGAHPLLWPVNFIMQMIEFAAKTVSHGMRLFGNMYAGELVFMLIALMGGAAAATLPGILLPIGHIIAGSIWAIFHIMIITLQAFIFMMLTLVYVGQAHDAH